MKIIANYKHNGKPTRALVTHEGRTYKRLNTSPLRVYWQEQIHTGEFHNIISLELAMALENEFAKVINAAPETPNDVSV